MRKYVTFLLLIVYTNCFSQEMEKPTVDVAMVSMHSESTVWLRWAPKTPIAWEIGNTNGWVVERVLLPSADEPGEKSYTILTKPELKPLPLNDWRVAVDTNQFAAVAAQMLYGEKIEFTNQSAAMMLINKSQELESRFSFSLTAADQDFEIARMMGLGLIDREVAPGRTYVYRVYANIKDTTAIADTAGVVVNLKEKYELPAVFDFNAEVRDTTISLQWPAEPHRRFYSSYTIEKRISEQEFEKLTPLPMVRLKSGDENPYYQYYTDYHPIEGDTLLYRVKGRTPFGNEGPPSKEQKIIIPLLFVEPSNLKYTEISSSKVKLEWEFSSEFEFKLKEFTVHSSVNLNEKPEQLATAGKNQRAALIDINKSELYLSVTAVGVDGNMRSSFPILVQTADSIPPSAPKSLNGKISKDGATSINWSKNAEPDIYGYRIYASTNPNAEFNLISKDFIRDTSYSWNFPLNTLSRNLYVKAMAYDNRYNYSAFSEMIRLSIPDTIPPTPPILRVCENTKEGVRFEWIPSGSADVKSHSLIAQPKSDGKTDTIATFTNTHQKQYLWDNPKHGEWIFFVAAKDSSGNESLSMQHFEHRIHVDFSDFTPTLKAQTNYNEGGITLEFSATGEANLIILYRAVNDDPTRIFRTLPAQTKKYLDNSAVVGGKYKYFIKLVTQSGKESGFSNEVEITF